MKNKDNLPYRQGIQTYIFNEQDELLIINTKGDENFWKVPTGGIDDGEQPKETLLRELKEELNIEVIILKELVKKNKYDWPEKFIEKSGYEYRGQEQTRFITKIKPNQKIKPCPKEINEYKFISLNETNQYLKLKSQQEAIEEISTIYFNLIKK